MDIVIEIDLQQTTFGSSAIFRKGDPTDEDFHEQNFKTCLHREQYDDRA